MSPIYRSFITVLICYKVRNPPVLISVASIDPAMVLILGCCSRAKWNWKKSKFKSKKCINQIKLPLSVRACARFLSYHVLYKCHGSSWNEATSCWPVRVQPQDFSQHFHFLFEWKNAAYVWRVKDTECLCECTSFVFKSAMHLLFDLKTCSDLNISEEKQYILTMNNVCF